MLLESDPTAPALIAQLRLLSNAPVPVTVAVRVVVSKARTLTFEAEIVTPVMLELGVLAAILKLMEANLLGSATLLARITVELEALKLGALKVTLEGLMALKLPPPLVMLQVTD